MRTHTHTHTHTHTQCLVFSSTKTNPSSCYSVNFWSASWLWSNNSNNFSSVLCWGQPEGPRECVCKHTCFQQVQQCQEPYCNCKDFYFYFSPAKSGACRLNRAREGGAIWRVGPDSWKYLRHKKLHIYACRGRYNLGQHVFPYNSHTVCHTFKNLVSPDSLNGAESPCNWPCPLPPRKFFS